MASRKARRLIAGAVTAVTAVGLGVVGVVLTQQASAATIDTGAYYVLKNRGSGKVLDIYDKSKADGAIVDQWTENDGDWQQFQFLDMGSGYYRLKAKHSSKVVNVANASKADGAAVVQSTGDSKATSQQWALVKLGSGTGSGSGSGSGSGTSPTAAWPAETGSVKVTSTVAVPASGLDGGNKRYYGIGDGSQDESQDPMFELADGATLANVILGTPAGDGVHCQGSCTLRNVWWLDVGEDAATFRGGTSSSFVVDGGGARSADDKVFQHNGGGTLTIKNFQLEDFGKLYRSCGNCSTQYKRTVVVQNVRLTAPGKSVVGINSNYGDTATLSGVTIVGDSSKKISICDRFTGNDDGDEPTKTGSGADGTYCKYSASDITYQ